MCYGAKWPKSAIWPRDLRWPWPQKGHLGLSTCLYMSQTRIMSIHMLLMRLLSAFCGGKALNVNVKHFVFDLTCDVTADPGFIFLTSSERYRPGLSIAVRTFPPRLFVTEIDGGGALRLPQQSAGVGLGPAGRGLMTTRGKKCRGYPGEVGRGRTEAPPFLVQVAFIWILFT